MQSEKRILSVFLLIICNILVFAASVDKSRLHELLKQAESHITSGNYEKAAELRDQALASFKELGAENDISTFSELHNISHAYYERRMCGDAVKTETILVEIFPLALPDYLFDYALYLNDLALYLLADNNIVLAEKKVEKALSLIKNENDIRLAIIYVRAAEIYQRTSPKRTNLSVEYQKKAVDAYASAYGRTNTKYLEELEYLARYYEEAEDYSHACNTYIELMNSREENDTEDNRQSLLSLIDRIIVCSRKINNTEQEKKYKQIALAIKLQGREFHEANYTSKFPSEKDSLDYLIISDKMDTYMVRLRQLSDDDEMVREQIQEEMKQYLSTLPDSYGKAYVLSFEALKKVLTRDWTGSIEYGIESLRIFDNLGIITDKYVMALCCMADAYNELHNPAKAYDYILRAFELRDDYLSSDNMYYNGIISDLALYCSELGNYKDAIKYGIMAVEAIEPAIYSDNPFPYFIALNNLATFYGAMGEDGTELKVLQYLVNRAEEIDPFVIDSPESPYLYNLASCFLNNGDCAQAIQTGLRVKEIREKDGNNYSISNIYYLLANAYLHEGQLEESFYFANQANSIQKEIGGDDNLSLSKSYDLLAKIYKDKDELEDAEKMERSSIDLAYNNIINNFLDLSSDDRTSYWNKLSDLFNIYYPNYYYQAKEEDATELYNKCALFAKGILLNTDTEMSKLIHESGDKKAIVKYQQLRSNRSVLSKMSSEETPETKTLIDSLRTETDKIERELIKECKVFGDYTMSMRTTWQDVQNALGPKDMAIEFLSFPLMDNKDSILNKTLYTAIVLRKNDSSPHFLVLFDDAELDKIGNNLFDDKLYNLIWEPLDNDLSGIDNVYFSPAGKLYNINLEVLPEIVGKNNKKNYYRVSSTRLLAHSDINFQNTEKAIIYGGLKYDASVSELIADSKLHPHKDSSYRGNLENLDYRSGWDYLPETLIEVNAIESALEKSKITTQIYTDTLGTEASFKSFDGQSCKIIHIATHGFYYTESDSARMKSAHLDYMANQMDRSSRSYREDYSLTRSGLLMAGCNNILRGYKLPENVDDGILFAKEIAGMNLKNVELTTLSSCESGLGDVTGDGVFGLQRAFKKAGVQSILMSLHKVDDEATRILMVEFYRNLMKGKSKYQSLKNAQKHLRKVEKGKFDKPEYWTSFILLDGLN